MKTKLTLDSLAVSVLVFLAVLVGMVILLGTQAGIRVTVDLPADRVIAPFQPVKMTFSEPVNFELASSVIWMDPILDGYLEFVDARTIQYVPISPFELNTTYTLSLSPDILNINGGELKKARAWEFTVREPLVAYLVTDAGQSSIWTMDLNGSPPQRLTDESVKVISFDAARTGEFIIFTVANTQGGIDLWRVTRTGGDASMLLDCKFDRCTTPTISPNGQRIAYSREAAGPTPDLLFGSPRIWVLDTSSGMSSPVYEDQQILGYHPTWSPDSNKLASFDGLADRINVIDLLEKKQYAFSSNTGGPITWSPDSNKILFTNAKQVEFGLRTQVEIADLSLGKSEPLLGQYDERDYAYYSLAWSSLEEKAILGFRAAEDRPMQILWLINPAILEGIIIADQDGYSYNSPQWDPWSNAVLFQQFKLKGAFNPEIGIWKPGFHEPLILTKGIMPHWLP
jgi:hypothetical protein